MKCLVSPRLSTRISHMCICRPRLARPALSSPKFKLEGRGWSFLEELVVSKHRRDAGGPGARELASRLYHYGSVLGSRRQFFAFVEKVSSSPARCRSDGARRGSAIPGRTTKERAESCQEKPFHSPSPDPNVRATSRHSPLRLTMRSYGVTTCHRMRAFAQQGTSRLQVSRRLNSTIVDRPSPPPFQPPPPPPPSVSAFGGEAQEPGLQQEDHGEAARRVFLDAVAAKAPRRDWTRKEIASIYYQPLMELAYQAVSSGCQYVAERRSVC